MDKTDFFIVMSLQLMNHLVREGYDCLRVEDNYRHPDQKVFLFEKTNGLLNEVDRYVTDSRKRGVRFGNQQQQQLTSSSG